MQEIGGQYSKDDRTDPSGFLRRARLHQSIFRANYLDLPYDTYGNYLTKEDGENGKNFYDGFGIFDAVKKYRKYNKPLYSNLLRSEHIPFNIFIPLDKDRNYYTTNFALMQHHKYSLFELESMLPWEREIYVAMLTQYIEEENEKIKQRQNSR